MSVFADTSALFALLDRHDARHSEADTLWRMLLAADTEIVCSRYVLLETFALLQNRLGMDAVRELHRSVCPALQIEWVTEADHQPAVSALLATSRRHISLVDCVSFEVMRRPGITQAVAFDPHFEEFGFACLRAGA